MNFRKKLLTRFLALTLLATFAGSAAHAQRQIGNADKILVTGEHTLRQSDIDRLTQLYEWLLGAEFTAAERGRYQTLIVRDARANERSAKAIAGMLESYEKVQALNQAKREQFRRELLPEIIAALENETNELNALLLSVYRNAQSETKSEDTGADDSRTNEPDDDKKTTSGGAIRVADLAGIWSTSSVSGTRYRSLVTGQLSDPSGSIIEYQISPGGNIKHVGYLSSTIYSCTTKLFISRTGRISINGSNITFDFSPGKRIYQTCSHSASRNDTLPAERKTYSFRLEQDQYGLQLCTVENGKNLCLRKKGD